MANSIIFLLKKITRNDEHMHDKNKYLIASLADRNSIIFCATIKYRLSQFHSKFTKKCSIFQSEIIVNFNLNCHKVKLS